MVKKFRNEVNVGLGTWGYMYREKVHCFHSFGLSPSKVDVGGSW